MDLLFELNSSETPESNIVINNTSPQSFYSNSNDNFSPPPSSSTSSIHNATMIGIDDFILDSNWSQQTIDSTINCVNHQLVNDTDSDSGMSSIGLINNNQSFIHHYDSTNSRSQSISNSSISSMADLNATNQQNNLLASLDACFYDGNSNDLHSIFESSPSDSSPSSSSSPPASLLMHSDDLNDQNLVYKQVDLFLNDLNINLNNLNQEQTDCVMNQPDNLNLYSDNLNNNTEQLINNIEYMLMQEIPENSNNNHHKQIIKVEPMEFIKTMPLPTTTTTIIVNQNLNDDKSNVNNKNYKKISPKLSPKSIILPKPVSCPQSSGTAITQMNTPVKNQTIFLNKMSVLTVPSPTNNNSEINDNNNSNNNTVTVKSKNNILLKNAINSNSGSLRPIIITTNSIPDNNNTIIISKNDEKSLSNGIPSAKKLKQETPATLIITNPPSNLKESDYKKVNSMDMTQVKKSVTTKTPKQNQACNNLALINNNNDQIDPSILKKQSRMIKNRESACLSRKRKKEYMQSLEENLKDFKTKNEELIRENLKLKEQVSQLENENKLLKSQNIQSIKINNSNDSFSGNKSKITLTQLKTTNQPIQINNTNSLKRPFVLLAIFLVFGLNIVQFININSKPSFGQNNLQAYSEKKIYLDPESAQLAALAIAEARDGALVDIQQLKNQNIKSRHLLSNYNSKESEDDQNTSKLKRPKSADLLAASSVRRSSNLTKINSNSNLTSYNNNNESMELVLINGTWHLLNLSYCYQTMMDANKNHYQNFSHLNKINNELNNWYERHQNKKFFNQHQNPSQQQQQYQQAKYTSSLLRNLNKNQNSFESNSNSIRSDQLSRESNSILHPNHLNENTNIKQKFNTNYAVSLYNRQNGRYENFAKSIRQRNDTFYYVSFRRDHVIFPALNQNKTKKPRMSLLVPALLSHLNESNNDNDNKASITFMQIDCEVIDTRLLQLKLNDIPFDYMKIMHQDYINEQQRQAYSSYNHDNKFY